jgi:hypothetical protein
MASPLHLRQTISSFSNNNNKKLISAVDVLKGLRQHKLTAKQHRIKLDAPQLMLKSHPQPD